MKVTMQHLQMSSANQELVKDMLRDLHGDDIELNEYFFFFAYCHNKNEMI